MYIYYKCKIRISIIQSIAMGASGVQTQKPYRQRQQSGNKTYNTFSTKMFKMCTLQQYNLNSKSENIYGN